MIDLLWLVPALPLLSFLVLLLFGLNLSQRIVSWIGAGSIGLACFITMGIGCDLIFTPPPNHAHTQILWTWFEVAGFRPEIAFHLDALSLVMMLVVTGVGFLIHLYSVGYMQTDDSYSRFFAKMNLFVAMMLLLVMADNLLLLYVGWEGVGLCSYLLIGFWYKEPDNCTAAQKAFIVTRVGDTAMALGFFMLVTQLNTLQVGELMKNATQQWGHGSGMATAAALLLLGGAVGKSGQLPLQTWLPDAMAGPTPVSALIHAATMVTAGVYLIARTHVLFALAPTAQFLVAVVGALTLLIAGFSALTQSDIKRVLAYSTISQIGYMFLALGVGAWSAAMFHFMTHAFFKALLFLGAGVVIQALHHEQNIFRMGGLARSLPTVFWTFLVGAGCLAGIPLITSGFYSKDAILWYAFSLEGGSVWFYLAGLIGAFMTAIYTFRMVFITFFGEAKGHIHHRPGPAMMIPLIILAAFALLAGFIELPHNFGHVQLFSHQMDTVFADVASAHGEAGHAPAIPEGVLQLVAGLVSLLGVGIAYYLFILQSSLPNQWANTPLGVKLHGFLLRGWDFDWLYDTLFVKPFIRIAEINKADIVDSLYNGLASLTRWGHLNLLWTQNGQVRWYATGLVVGAIILMGVMIFL
jgi:NADH-quinone oxidoreductase subunit L